MYTSEGYEIFYTGALVGDNMYYLPVNATSLNVYNVKSKLNKVFLELPIKGSEYLYMVVYRDDLYIIPRYFHDDIIVVSLMNKSFFILKKMGMDFDQSIMDCTIERPIVNEKIRMHIGKSQCMLYINPIDYTQKLVKFHEGSTIAGEQRKKLYDLIYAVNGNIYIADLKTLESNRIICGIEEPKYFEWNSFFVFFSGKIDRNLLIYLYDRRTNILTNKTFLLSDKQAYGRYLGLAILDDQYLMLPQLTGNYILILDLEKWTMKQINIFDKYGKTLNRLYLNVFCVDSDKALFVSDDSSIPMLCCESGCNIKLLEKPAYYLRDYLKDIIQGKYES